MREKRMVERGPRKSGREEFGEMRGREGFWIGWEEAARDEISCARELRVSSVSPQGSEVPAPGTPCSHLWVGGMLALVSSGVG